MNKSFLNQEKPLLTVMLQCETPEVAISRIRNSLHKGAEGFAMNNCFGTHLTGPIMVKNPAMLRFIAEKIVGKIDANVRYDYMERSYQTTVEALEKRLAEQK